MSTMSQARTAEGAAVGAMVYAASRANGAAQAGRYASGAAGALGYMGTVLNAGGEVSRAVGDVQVGANPNVAAAGAIGRFGSSEGFAAGGAGVGAIVGEIMFPTGGGIPGAFIGGLVGGGGGGLAADRLGVNEAIGNAFERQTESDLRQMHYEQTGRFDQ